MTRVAVILFNLGGPDQASAIKPFLYNLFRDPAIIPLPGGLRHLVAWLIATRRAPTAAAIYAHMGGRSPILPQTEAQAAALEEKLATDLGGTVKVFIAMRYWHPFARETVAAVKQWKPDGIVLLPLYPQYSTTTTGSSVVDWTREATRQGLGVQTTVVENYPVSEPMIKAQVDLLRQAMARIGERPFRVLFSAHGLPESIVAKGDPYPDQIAQTALAVAKAAGLPAHLWRVSFQSRVGPTKWIEPYTDREIAAAGAEGLAVVVMPIAFVSEHSETLVELDIEYRELAAENGVTAYERVPALGLHPLFIEALTGEVVASVAAQRKERSHD
jgi:ferrochelatase